MSGELPRHYEILGVDPSASMAEIKRAYLSAARAAHPDHHGHSDAARRAAEVQMRNVNAAWGVLGDVDERAAYDRQRLRGDRQNSRAATGRPAAGHGAPFRPLHPEADEIDFDERDDRPITDSALPGWLAVGPAALLILGFVSIGFGAIVGAGQVMTFGIISLVIAGVLFLVAAPIVALGRAIRGERAR